MTPSLIRRFAKYHRIGIAWPDELLLSHGPGALADSIYKRDLSPMLARRCSVCDQPEGNDYVVCRDNIVQALTLIEAAERAFAIADDKDPESIALFNYAIGMLEQAGIDPDKWREVKE